MEMAGKIAYGLAEKGVTVVSGMARGIDSAAHRGALKAGGRTIAVMGSGFNYLYPPENKVLAEEIAAGGAVVTEFDADTEPFKQNFPKRNRIISGLAKGVVVVEAAKKSGAMITVRLALEQGREVFAVPGRADTLTSGGTNELIQKGAKLVTSAEEVLEEILLDKWTPEGKEHSSENVKRKKINERSERSAHAGQNSEDEGLSAEELSVLDAMKGNSPMHIDRMSERSGLSAALIGRNLLKLELKGRIKALAGKRYEII
jgi:DNA processing protein